MFSPKGKTSQSGCESTRYVLANSSHAYVSGTACLLRAVDETHTRFSRGPLARVQSVSRIGQFCSPEIGDHGKELAMAGSNANGLKWIPELLSSLRPDTMVAVHDHYNLRSTERRSALPRSCSVRYMRLWHREHRNDSVLIAKIEQHCFRDVSP